MTDNDPAYLAALKANFAELSAVLDGWIQKVSQSQKIDRENVPTVDLATIDTLSPAFQRRGRLRTAISPAGRLNELRNVFAMPLFCFDNLGRRSGTCHCFSTNPALKRRAIIIRRSTTFNSRCGSWWNRGPTFARTNGAKFYRAVE